MNEITKHEHYCQLTEGGQFWRQINGFVNVEWGAHHYCPAWALTPEEAAHFRVMPLVEVPPPAHDPITQHCYRDGAELIGGEWRFKWTVEPRAPEQIAELRAAQRAEVWERIKAERDRRKFAGVKVGAAWFQSDPDSRTQQVMLYAKAISGKPVPAVPWKVLGGAFVPMSAALAEQIGDATEAHDIALFAHAEALRAQVNAAADPTAIDILAGWPPAFGE